MLAALVVFGQLAGWAHASPRRPTRPTAHRLRSPPQDHAHLQVQARPQGIDPEAPLFLPLLLGWARIDRLPLPATVRPPATGTPVTTATPTAGPTSAAPRVEEDSSQVVLTGGWEFRQHAEASGGGYAVSSRAGDSLSLTFTGEHLVVYRTVGPEGGQASVRVDGLNYGRMEFYFPEQRWQVPAVLDLLGAGEHTLVLTVTGRHHRDASGTNVYVDALQAPSPFEPSEDQRRAEARVNDYRDLVGLPRVQLDRAINLAAQSHAVYAARHGEVHYETFGRPGFTGVGPGDRCRYFGYNFPQYEVMNYWADPARAVDSWMATVYHRLPFMSYRTMHIGYGGSGAISVIDTGTRGYTPPAERLIATYPVDGQRGVRTSWSGGESPDPLPGKPRPVGFPVSLHIAVGRGSELAWSWPTWLGSAWPTAGPFAVGGLVDPGPAVAGHPVAQPDHSAAGWQLASATLRGPDGQEVPTYVLDQSSDPAQFLRADVVFLVARRPLEPGTTYTVQVAGTDSQGQAFDHRWSFTTATRTTAAHRGSEGEPLGQPITDRFSAAPAMAVVRLGMAVAAD